MNTKLTYHLQQATKQHLNRVLVAALCVFGSFAFSVQSVSAQEMPSIGDLTKDASSNYLVAPAPAVGLKQATAIARDHTGGRVLSANKKQRSGQVVYRVRMLVDGERVVTVVVDAEGKVRQRR